MKGCQEACCIKNSGVMLVALLDSIDATKSNYTTQLLARHHHENLDLIDSPTLVILLDRRTIHT
jgi:hypothetical protein